MSTVRMGQPFPSSLPLSRVSGRGGPRRKSAARRLHHSAPGGHHVPSGTEGRSPGRAARGRIRSAPPADRRQAFQGRGRRRNGGGGAEAATVKYRKLGSLEVSAV